MRLVVCAVLAACVLVGLGPWSMAAGDGAAIRLRVAVIDTAGPGPEIPAHLRFAEDRLAEPGMVIVQADRPLDEAFRGAVESTGARIVDYVPDHAYVVKAEPAVWDALGGLDSVRWLGRYEPFYKLNPHLAELPRDGERQKLFLLGFRGESLDDAARVIARGGGELVTRYSVGDQEKLTFRIAGNAIDAVCTELAHLEAVEWIEPAPAYSLCNDNTAWVCQSGLYEGQATPLYDRGIHGEGQIVAVMDTGADADMCYFYDSAQGLPGATPNYDQRKIVAYIGDPSYTADWDSHGHGTHTAGTIAGDNFATPGLRDSGDGIAVAAQLIIQDYGNSYDVYPPDDEYGAIEETIALGASVHSNSWGWPGHSGEYHIHSSEVDQVMWDYQEFLLVYAAGNEGSSPDRIRPPGTAKNVLTVGATDPGTAAENMASFSSHGPTDDGRRKPDISICGGYSIYSADSDGNINTFNCSTTGMAGTSMATPGAAGCAALVRQYFTEGWYPTGSPSPSQALTPSGALLKAMLINSGDNMTGQYTADSGSGHGDIPTNGQGWGRIHLDNALYFDGDTRLLWVEDNRDGISTGETHEYYLSVIDESENLEVTLVYSDYPGNPGASPALVNNLNLVVVAPDGTEYLGNNYSGGLSVPGGNPDNLNPVECVELAAPATGSYTVRVEGYEVPQGPQPYALVATGGLGFSDGQVGLDRGEYGCSDTVTMMVTDADLRGAGTQEVTLKSTSDPEGEVILLTETGPDTGVFTGTAETTDGFPGPGQVLVAHDDVLTCIYIDADDGHGGINVEKTAEATIDCQGPVISDVTVAGNDHQSATITWTTDEPATSVIHYGTDPGLGNFAEDPTLVTEHEIVVDGLDPCTAYVFEVWSEDEGANRTVDDNGGALYMFVTDEYTLLLEANMDTNPGWTYENLWAWGQPTGQGGYYGGPDPTSGYTGDNVVGFNLNGDYVNFMPEYNATTPPIDCTGGQNVTLKFRRWLGVERSLYDHAYVRVSNDGVTWVTIWENPDSELYDGEWVAVEYDISEVADDQPTVYIRWVMGTTDEGWVYCGWNIDDVEVSYTTECVPPTFTPSPSPVPTVTPTPSPSPSPTDSPSPTATGTPEPTATDTPAPTRTPTAPAPSPTAYATNTPPGNPTRTPTPAATPEPGITQIYLILNAGVYQAGDPFLFQARVRNTNPPRMALEYIVLDVWGSYWFWPSWTQQVDNVLLSLTEGFDRTETILDFVWPEGAGSGNGIVFWGALLDPSTQTLIGDLASRSFDFR